VRERWRDLAWRAREPLPPPREGGWDGLRVGSEGCARLVPGPSRVDATGRSDPAPGAVSLVTPLLPPSEYARVLEAALAALEAGWAEVVVNDWGLLSALAGKAQGRLTAGRLLMRARRGPGEGDPWEGLDPASREYFAWGPLGDRPFLDFLRGKGVERLELDPPRHWHPLRVPPGFRLSLHADHRLVTLAGNCPFLYREGEGRWAEGDCRLACRERAIHLTAPGFAPPGSGSSAFAEAAADRSAGRLFRFVQSGRLVLEEAPGAVAGGGLPEAADRLVFSPNLFPQIP
jgi:hypothetical protein